MLYPRASCGAWFCCGPSRTVKPESTPQPWNSCRERKRAGSRRAASVCCAAAVAAAGAAEDRRVRPMPKLIVLYPPPADVDTFERRYHADHAPMVLGKIPGLKKFVAALVLGTPAGAAAYHRGAERYFDSTGSLQAAMGAPGGQST